MMNQSTDFTQDLETHGSFTKIFRLLSVPILNHIPSRFLRLAMRKTSHDAATVTKNGGSTTALEAMYTRHHRHPFARGFFSGLADFFWHNAISQPKALRNRLKIVERIVTEVLIQKQREGRSVNVLNVAGGSSRAIIQVLARLKSEGTLSAVQILNLDKDARAIELGKRIADECGVGSHFSWLQGNISELSVLVGEQLFDLIEMVGLLDYFSDEKTVQILSLLRAHLATGGSIIVANVMPNEEVPFIHKTGWPAMHYRTPEELSALLSATGFGNEHDILIEPLHIHVVIRVSV